MSRVTAAAVITTLVALCPSMALAFGGQPVGEVASPVAEPSGLAVANDQLWIADLAARQVVQFEPSGGTVLARIDAPGFQPTGVAWFEQTLWLADRGLDRLSRLRPPRGPDLAPVPYYGRWAAGIVHDGTHVWVVMPSRPSSTNLIPTTVRRFARWMPPTSGRSVSRSTGAFSGLPIMERTHFIASIGAAATS